jgi:hypothetical protein
MSGPTARLLSLGAGVQSTSVLILAARGELPRLDGAIFSDTGWEPAAVYAHLDRLEREVAGPAGIPIYRVASGDLRRDALDPSHRFASLPLYVRNPDGSDGMGRRQCTSEYKLKPIKRKVREILGAALGADGVPGRVPRGRWAEQWVGISTDEQDRALDAAGQLKVGTVSYERLRYPLLELDLSRSHCAAVNASAGFPDTPKSACVGCPFHTNRMWRTMRDTDPDAWADAVAFDREIRTGYPHATAAGHVLRRRQFVHRTRLPLDQAPIDRVTAAEWKGRQGDLVAEVTLAAFQESLDDDAALGGCSPYGCHTGQEDDD